MKTKRMTGLMLVLALVGASFAAQAANTDSLPLDKRSIYSDYMTNKRLAPVGNVCVEGQKCVTPAATVASAPAAKTEPMTPKQVFAKHCTMCHKTGVAGAPIFGNAESWAPHIAKGEKTLYHSALNGFKGMPARGMCTECSDAEVEATVRYMVNNSGGHFKAPPASAKPAADAKQSTSAAAPHAPAKAEPAKAADTKVASNGMAPKEVFTKHCAMCHKTGIAGAPVFGNKDAWAPHIAKGEKTLYHSALNGFKAMPPRGMCTECSDSEIKATVRYMVNHSGGDFK